jgi:hypothetical protein
VRWFSQVIKHDHADKGPSLALHHPAISLVGVILIARPTFLFGSPYRIPNGLPVSPDWGDEVSSGSRTSWHDKVYDPDTGVLIRTDTPAERLTSVGFACLGFAELVEPVSRKRSVDCAWRAGDLFGFIWPEDTTIRAIGHRARPFHSIAYFSFYCVAVSVV